MKKISFRLRSFDKEQFLTFNIDNNAELDEEILDFLEEEEPEGIVSIIFEEQDEFDTFSYDITDKIHLCELSNQEINAEMVLMVLRGLVTGLLNMSEYRIPLSYLVLNRQYIYIDSDYKVEFVCIPLEDMNEEADLTNFFRNFIASLRFDPSEDGDYVAKLLTYVNNREVFSLRNLLELVEEQMERMGIEIPEGGSNEIYGEYTEVDESNDSYEASVSDVSEPTYEEPVTESYEPAYEEPATEGYEPANEELVEEKIELTQEEPEADSDADDKASLKQDTTKQKRFKTKDAGGPVGVVIEDDFNEFMADQEDPLEDEAALKFRKDIKDIKINRASIVKNTEDEIKALEEQSEEAEESQEADDKEKEPAKKKGRTKKDKTEKTSRAGKKSAKKDEDKATPEKEPEAEGGEDAPSQTVVNKNNNVPKVNPYLLRVNTDERIMIMKQTFKIGKAGMGVDYTITGNGAISRVHAIITGKDGEYFIRDNKSTNHTFVDGQSVEEGESAKLTDGCKIVLGDEEFIFKMQ